MAAFQPHPSSYRDPSGFLFYHEGGLYRQVNRSFADAFEQFQRNGLSQHLVSKGLLTPYGVLEQNLTGREDWFLTLRPERIPFISYPFEWCFDMLKDAALVTLEAALEAMQYNMLLKDAPAYNLQWHNGRMQVIDTLSFEPYDEQKPWVAYRQFCEHFLAPLALMHFLQTPLQGLQLAYPDGIPLALTKKLLPGRSRWSLHLFLHLHLHAKLAAKAGGTPQAARPFSRQKMQQLLTSLQTAVASLRFDKPSGVWSGYYEEALQRDSYVQQKKEIVAGWIASLPVKSVLDAGANEGEFSMLLASQGLQVVSADFDHYAINRLYNNSKKEKRTNVLPLLLDLGNPSPAIGVNNEERASFLQRFRVDAVLALAVVHHLAIGKNIDFEKIAALFRQLGTYLLIEFVPKEDEKVKLLLQQKTDSYKAYSEERFQQVFQQFFTILDKQLIGQSGRTIYLLKRHA